MEIKLNNSNNNPFYGLRNCLNLLNMGANSSVELRDYHKDQFIKFLNEGLFNEYVCLDNLFRSRVQSTRMGKVIK